MAAYAEIVQSRCRVNVLETPGSDWDPFVTGSPDSSIYHLSGWTEIAREVFGHRALFVESRDTSGSLTGVLPVIRQRSWLLGNFATSLAFFNYGGALAADPMVAQQLMIRASEAAEALGCRYLEFRDVQPRPGEWTRRTDKVTLRLDLPDTAEELSKRLGSKLRSQVKRAEREGTKCRTGTVALLDDFYAVFAENMRDLGTPVYPKALLRGDPQTLRAELPVGRHRIAGGAVGGGLPGFLARLRRGALGIVPCQSEAARRQHEALLGAALPGDRSRLPVVRFRPLHG